MLTLHKSAGGNSTAGFGVTLARSVIRLWHQLLSIDVHPELTAGQRQRKRVHLLKGISCVTIAIYAGYVLAFSNLPDWLTFRICLCGVFLNLPPLCFNYYRRYDAAAYYSVLSVTLLCAFIAVARKHDGIEYYLIANSIVAMLFFRTFWKVLLLFSLNAAAFFLSAPRHDGYSAVPLRREQRLFLQR